MIIYLLLNISILLFLYQPEVTYENCSLLPSWPQKPHNILQIEGPNLCVHSKNTQEIAQAIKGMYI
jgi:hypothetical protein